MELSRDVLKLQAECSRLRCKLNKTQHQLSMGFKVRRALLKRIRKQRMVAAGLGQCVICLDDVTMWGILHKNTVHLSMCTTCAPKAGSKCPVCRQPGSLVQIFVS